MHVGMGEGVIARRVRVSFRAAHASPPRHQYYTVRALTIAARCLCHGHASECNVDAQVREIIGDVTILELKILSRGDLSN